MQEVLVERNQQKKAHVMTVRNQRENGGESKHGTERDLLLKVMTPSPTNPPLLERTHLLTISYSTSIIWSFSKSPISESVSTLGVIQIQTTAPPISECKAYLNRGDLKREKRNSLGNYNRENCLLTEKKSNDRTWIELGRCWLKNTKFQLN